ncbi:MAG TPA: AAA family ATPase [Streptosporangiaceae bacterium]|nr:AAA family ATPase [Streptosporangiaceae bacterium]
MAGPGAVVADRGAIAAGQIVLMPKPDVPRRPVRLPRPPVLAGREELLARLHDLLTSGEQPPVVVLRGMGGVGKTSLAAGYAHQHLAELGVAWQVQAENPALLAAGLAELAAQLGAVPGTGQHDPVASLHAVLAAYPERWLLVFDNAPGAASVRRFLPPAGRGRVVITSQNQHWPGDQTLDVPVLGRETAAEFLTGRTGDRDEAAARELAGELGGLPLALEQAAAYIAATGGTIAGYLGLYQRRSADLLARGEPAGYIKTVATTWDLAFKRLEQDTPAASGLLRLLAYFAPEPVPLRLLLRRQDPPPDIGTGTLAVLGTMSGDRLAIGDAIAALRRYSLVTALEDGVVLVHRLVLAVTRQNTAGDAAV